METHVQRRQITHSLWAAAPIGVGLMAALDEIVFHQHPLSRLEREQLD